MRFGDAKAERPFAENTRISAEPNITRDPPLSTMTGVEGGQNGQACIPRDGSTETIQYRHSDSRRDSVGSLTRNSTPAPNHPTFRARTARPDRAYAYSVMSGK